MSEWDEIVDDIVLNKLEAKEAKIFKKNQRIVAKLLKNKVKFKKTKKKS